MRTTIDLPDELSREIQARAARDGVTPEAVILRLVERELRAEPIASPSVPTSKRGLGPLPVMIPPTGRMVRALTSDELHRIEEEEDIEKHERSLGR